MIRLEIDWNTTKNKQKITVKCKIVRQQHKTVVGSKTINISTYSELDKGTTGNGNEKNHPHIRESRLNSHPEDRRQNVNTTAHSPLDTT
ncbi:hypothetical protein GWI33_005793 [Rhynchophorus ferrugineus]|uniref:Uncharacterized protein n=1 Tax=Rhynchophorus ferrugineus TaxID=354439 RepID=A0A834ITU2_RHYFE|nr:hypothetical protein GWI33_005793 [Rhynchophorus ferrugineus]